METPFSYGYSQKESFINKNCEEICILYFYFILLFLFLIIFTYGLVAQCEFAPGLRESTKRIPVGSATTEKECVNRCEKEKQTSPDINGVSIAKTGPVDCHCEKDMKTAKQSAWKHCFLNAKK